MKLKLKSIINLITKFTPLALFAALGLALAAPQTAQAVTYYKFEVLGVKTNPGSASSANKDKQFAIGELALYDAGKNRLNSGLTYVEAASQLAGGKCFANVDNANSGNLFNGIMSGSDKWWSNTVPTVSGADPKYSVIMCLASDVPVKYYNLVTADGTGTGAVAENRVVTKWALYKSSNGTVWEEIDKQTYEDDAPDIPTESYAWYKGGGKDATGPSKYYLIGGTPSSDPCWVRFTITKKYPPTGTSDKTGLALSRFALYDEGNNLLNDSLTDKTSVTSSPTDLEEGWFRIDKGSWGAVTIKDTETYAKVFVPGTSKMYFTKSETEAKALENGDSAYYVTFTMRLQDGAKPAKYNLAVADSGSGIQGRYPMSWKVETSTSGSDPWTTVSVINDITPPNSSYNWYNGGGATVSSNIEQAPSAFYEFGECIANGGFESGTVVTRNSGQWDYGPGYSSGTAQTGSWVLGSSSGITKSDQTWIGTGFVSGTYAAFMHNGCSLSCTFTAPVSGEYNLSFKTTKRFGSSYGGDNLAVKIDEVEVYSCTTTADVLNPKIARNLSAGVHTLTLIGTKPASVADGGLVIDDVSLKYVGSGPEPTIPVITYVVFSPSSRTYGDTDWEQNPTYTVKDANENTISSGFTATWSPATITGAGSYTLTVTGDSTTCSGTKEATYTVYKATPVISGTLTISDCYEGDTPSPSGLNTTFGTVTYTYADSETATSWSGTPPTAVGTHYVRGEVAASENWNAATPSQPKSFQIKEKPAATWHNSNNLTGSTWVPVAAANNILRGITPTSPQAGTKCATGTWGTSRDLSILTDGSIPANAGTSTLGAPTASELVDFAEDSYLQWDLGGVAEIYDLRICNAWSYTGMWGNGHISVKEVWVKYKDSDEFVNLNVPVNFYPATDRDKGTACFQGILKIEDGTTPIASDVVALRLKLGAKENIGSVVGLHQIVGEIEATGTVEYDPYQLSSLELSKSHIAIWGDEGWNTLPTVKAVKNHEGDSIPTTGYTATWDNSLSGAGNYTLTITGKSPYYGTLTANYTVNKRPIAIPVSPLTSNVKIGDDGKVATQNIINDAIQTVRPEYWTAYHDYIQSGAYGEWGGPTENPLNAVVSLKDKNNTVWLNSDGTEGGTGDRTISWTIAEIRETITLNDNGATTAGPTSVKIAPGYPMPTLSSLPEKTNDELLGYYDAKGVKYYNADGTGAVNPFPATDWPTSLSAQWKYASSARVPKPSQRTFLYAKGTTRDMVSQLVPSAADGNYEIVSGGGTTSAEEAGVYSFKIRPQSGFKWDDDGSYGERTIEWGIVPSNYAEPFDSTDRSFLKTLENSQYRVSNFALPPGITGGDIFLRFPNPDGKSHDFVHIFTNTAASGFVFENNSGSPRTGRVLIVGGGGGSGFTKSRYAQREGHITGGGGGGGGVRSFRDLQFNANGVYPIVVGQGGAAGNSSSQGANGGDSKFQYGSIAYTVAGGGGGGTSSADSDTDVTKGLSGGSGGGGAGRDGTGGTGDGDGYAGGVCEPCHKPADKWVGESYVGAGGGGAGKSGWNGCASGESGGYGFLTDILAAPGVLSQYVCVGGGGAGGGIGEYAHGKTLGGFGGGGSSYVNTTLNNNETGVNGLGGGASASSTDVVNAWGGGLALRGGDGIVIVRYNDSVQTPKIRTIQIPTIQDEYVFNYDTHRVLLSNGEMLVDTDDYTVSGDFGGMYIQEYTVVLSLKDPANTQWSNRETQSQKIKWRIVHKDFNDDRSFFKILATNHNRVATAPLGVNADIVLRSEVTRNDTRYYRYELVYKNSKSITFSETVNNAEVLLVGGGGAGGSANGSFGGGGGGGGGVNLVKSVSFTANQSYALTVGQGGQTPGEAGVASTFGTASETLWAAGGGAGGGAGQQDGNSVSSGSTGGGGGGGGNAAGGTGGSQNNDGGNGFNSSHNNDIGGGGGGGALGPGRNGGWCNEHSTGTPSGGAGIVLQDAILTGHEGQAFGGGGAGGWAVSSFKDEVKGGEGGGGSAWAKDNVKPNEVGMDGLGGGGAGGSTTSSNNGTGRAGGDGIVVIAFEIEAGSYIDKPKLVTDRFTYSGNAVSIMDYLTSKEHMEGSGDTEKTNVGEFRFSVVPASGFRWSDEGTEPVSFDWSISAKPIQGEITVDSIPDQTYSGSKIEPKPTVRDKESGAILSEVTEYTLAYSGNENIGTAAIQITGRGNYTGVEYAYFKIVANPNEDSFFVTSNATPDGDGLGWETPTTLASALTKAQSATKPVAIYMKEGTYTISSACSLSSSGQDVRIMGGYLGVGLARSQNFSVLDDAGTSGLLSLTSTHAITLQQLELRNSAAAVTKAGSGALTVEHCLFDNNKTAAALQVSAGLATVENCTFAKNAAGSVDRTGGTVTIKNSILWNTSSSTEVSGTVTLQYVLLPGSATGTGVIHSDPLFVNAANNDFHLKSTAGHYTSGDWVTDTASSPAIDAGNPTADCSSEPKNSSDQNFGLNLGVYGNTAQASKSPVKANVTVTFEKGEGSGGTASVTGLEGTAMPAVLVPTRENYNFMGYFTEANGTGTKYYDENGQPVDSPVFSTSVTALYANWEAATVTVTLDQNSTSATKPNPATVTATPGSAMPQLEQSQIPTRTGYTFTGYFNAATDGTKYYNADGTSAKTCDLSEGAVLYAQWTANTYNVAYELNGGAHGANYPTKGTYGQRVQVSAPRKTGYTFTGWTVSDFESSAVWYKITSEGLKDGTKITSGTQLCGDGMNDIAFFGLCDTDGNTATLTANWTPITYTITYEGLKDGATHSNPTSYTIETSTITFMPPTEVSGYKFADWSPASITKGSTGDKTVTANYLTEVVKPEGANLTYNGSTQTGVAANAGYNVENGSEKNAGNYTATVTLNDGYCWEDGDPSKSVNVSWSIAKKGLKVKGLSGVDRPYDGTLNVTIDVSAAYPNPDAVCSGDSVTIASAPTSATIIGLLGPGTPDVGEKKYFNYDLSSVVLGGTAAGNYKADSYEIASMNVTPRVLTLGWGTTEFTYDGEPHCPTCTLGNFVSGEGEGSSATVTGDATEPGTHTATVEDWDIAGTGKKSNYALPTPASTTFTITAETVNLDDNEGSEGEVSVNLINKVPEKEKVNCPFRNGWSFRGYWTTKDDDTGTEIYDRNGDRVGTPELANGQTLYAHWEFIETYYLKNNDPDDANASFVATKTPNTIVGWREVDSAAANKDSVRHTVAKGHKYVATAMLCTPKDTDGSVIHEFAGNELTLTGNFALYESVKIANLISSGDNGASIYTWANKYHFRVEGAIHIDDESKGKRISFVNCGTSRTMEIAASITGSDTTSILLQGQPNAGQSDVAYTFSGDFTDFKGVWQKGSTEFPQGCTIDFSGKFGGKVKSVPTVPVTNSTKMVSVWFNHDNLPESAATRGLEMACADATDVATIQTNITFYSSKANFDTPFFPLMTFPADTTVDPTTFTVYHAATADGTKTPFKNLGRIFNSDGTITLVANAVLSAVREDGPKIYVDPLWLSDACPGKKTVSDYQTFFLSTNPNGVSAWAAYILGFAGNEVSTAALIEKTTQSAMSGGKVMLTVALTDMPTARTVDGCEVKYSLLTSANATELQNGKGDVVAGCEKRETPSFSVPAPTTGNHAYYRIRVHFSFSDQAN